MSPNTNAVVPERVSTNRLGIANRIMAELDMIDSRYRDLMQDESHSRSRPLDIERPQEEQVPKPWYRSGLFSPVYEPTPTKLIPNAFFITRGKLRGWPLNIYIDVATGTAYGKLLFAPPRPLTHEMLLSRKSSREDLLNILRNLIDFRNGSYVTY